MVMSAAVLVLAACARLQDARPSDSPPADAPAADARPAQAVSLPPGIAPFPDQASQHARTALERVLELVGPPQYAPPPRGAAPAPGSATESEALRRYVRAQVRKSDGQTTRASEDLDAALRLDPSSAPLHSARAAVAADTGDLARAVGEWEAVLAVDPGNANAALSVAIVAVDTGQAERAISLLGPLWKKAATGADLQLNESGKFALGSTLAHALLRMGFDEASLAPSRWALQTDAVKMSAERGDGQDATARAMGALGRDAGEAAVRVGLLRDAAELLSRSVQLVPDTRAQALAVYAALSSGKTEEARTIARQMLARGAPATELGTQVAEWALRRLNGDADVAQEMELLLKADAANGRAARLLAAARPAQSTQVLDDVLAAGAFDGATLRAALRGMPLEQRTTVALRTLRADPSLVRTMAREYVRAAPTTAAWMEALRTAPETPEREALRAACASYARAPGAAWRVVQAALEQWPDEPVLFFARIEAAATAADPSLVQNSTVDASELLQSDAAWHAAVARAASATGLEELAAASLARSEALDPTSDEAPKQRAATAGNALPGTARGRAEQAISRGDGTLAAAELVEARAVDPDDDAALGMLMRVLPRTIGPEATLEWAQDQVDATPNDPLLWEAVVLQAGTLGRGSDALGMIDRRLAADPDDTVVLAAREALLRAAGQTGAALAAARERTSSLPPGPRRSLEQAAVEAQGGDAAQAVKLLDSFADSAFPPPMGMRGAALEVARRLPASAERAAVMRRIARDAILADAAAPLEFFAFEALSAASDPSLDAPTRASSVLMIAHEACEAPLHRSAEAAEHWRGACDFLAAQGFPAEGAEFVRVRLADSAELPDAARSMLARAAFAADALTGEGARASNSLQLMAELIADDHSPFPPEPGRPAHPLVELAAIYTVVGDNAGSMEVLESACTFDPDDAIALNNLAYARAEAGLVDDRTLELANKALAGRPNEPSHMDTLAWIRYLRGQINDADGRAGALSLLRKAVELAGKNASAEMLLHFGDARWRAEDRAGALESWNSALRAATVLDRPSTLALYRQVLRQRTALGSVDPERYYVDHDVSVIDGARARINAAEAGRTPPVAPFAPAAKPAPGASQGSTGSHGSSGSQGS